MVMARPHRLLLLLVANECLLAAMEGQRHAKGCRNSCAKSIVWHTAGSGGESSI